MRIVVFGLTISSSWGNGHATLWRGLARALAGQGCRLVFLERDQPFYAQHRDLRELPGGELVIYPDWPEIAARARCEIAGADAVIVTSYCADALAATELIASARRPLRVFYDLDTPVTLARLSGGEAVGYIGPRGLQDFDLVLSFTGGRALAALRDRLGARRVAPLYGHVDPDVYRRVAPARQYAADLSYLGTYAADRQPQLETMLLGAARRLSQRRFVIGGAQYPADFPWLPSIHFVRHLPPGEHPAFFSSSRATLNVTRAAMARMGWCPSGRLFESAACGAPVVSDAWEGLDRFYRPGSEILLARGTEDVVAALEMSDAELVRIGTAARERTLDEHTSAHRARELLQLMAGAGAPMRTEAENA